MNCIEPQKIMQGLLVAPNLLLGTTDSRHYADLSDAILRFLPLAVNRTAGAKSALVCPR